MSKFKTKSKKFALLAVAAIALTACGGSSENSSSETTAAARTKNNALLPPKRPVPGALSTTTTAAPVALPGATVPDAPYSLGGVAGPNQVELYWKAPANNGGAAITNYYVEMSTDSGATWSKAGWSTATKFLVGGLVSGKSYDFTVKAANSVGLGTASLAAKGITPLSSTGATAAPTTTVTPAPTKLTTPSAPTALTGRAMGSQLALFWTAPVSNGGGAIADYLVEVSTNFGQTWSKAGYSKTTTFMVNGLVPLRLYTFKVSANNSVGLGAASSPSKPLSVR